VNWLTAWRHRNPAWRVTPGPLTPRGGFKFLERRRMRRLLRKAGIRMLPFSFGSALSIVSDLDGTLRRRYDAYVGLLTGDLGLDFGDSIWLQWNLLPRRLHAVVGFGFLTPQLTLGQDAPAETFNHTRTFAENVAEFHKGNVDHFHAFLPKGPRAVLLRRFEISSGTTAVYVLNDFIQDGPFDCRAAFIFGVCIVSKTFAPPDIRSVAIHDSDGKMTLLANAGMGRIRRDGKHSAVFALPQGVDCEDRAVKLDSIGRLLIEVATEDDLAMLDFVFLVNPFGALVIERLLDLRDRYNIETCLATEHSDLYFRDPELTAIADARNEKALQSEGGKIGAYNGAYYGGAAAPMFSTDADDPDSPFCVFPALTSKLNFRFVVPRAASYGAGLDPLNLVTPSPTRAGGGIYWARRVLPALQSGSTKAVSDEPSRHKNFAGHLMKALAGCAVRPGRFWPLYTHLGGLMVDPPQPNARRESAEDIRNRLPSPYLDSAATHALQDRVFNISGTVKPQDRVWFARATVLYDYALIVRSIGEHVARPDGNTIQITSWNDATIGRMLPLCPAQLYGVTFYVDDPRKAAVFLDGSPVTTLIHNDPDQTGRLSVTIAEGEIRFPLFDDFDPARTAASECIFSNSVWRRDPDEGSPGRLVVTAGDTSGTGASDPDGRNLGSVRLLLDGWCPIGSQLFAFAVMPGADVIFGVLIETETGGKFFFGDAQLAAQIDVAFDATYFPQPQLMSPGSWNRIVVPFHDLSWSPGAKPGGPMPSHKLKSLSVFAHGAPGAGIGLRDMAFLRPRATGSGGGACCVTGVVPGFLPRQSVHLVAIADSGISRTESVDQRGFFCFDRLPPGPYRIWTLRDGAEICDRRGPVVLVSSNLTDLRLARPAS